MSGVLKGFLGGVVCGVCCWELMKAVASDWIERRVEECYEKMKRRN